MLTFDWTFLERIDGHPMVTVCLLILVWLYQKLARRFSSWPKIPFGLVKIALVLFLIDHIIITQIANPSLDRFFDVASTLALYLGILRAIVYVIVDFIVVGRRGVRVPAITSDLVLGIVWFLAIMVILRQKLNFDLASLITTSAILTAVVGFALQDTLGNLFAGLAIQAEKPYQLGDWVRLSEYTGRVDGISWKSTKIVTTTRQTIYIPNSAISKTAIFNYSQPTPEYVATMDVGISYDNPPNQVRRILLDVMGQHPQILHERQSEVYIKTYADSSILYQLRFWVNNYATENRIKSDLQYHIWYRFRREGIKIPFPTRELIQTQPKVQVTAPSVIEEILESVDLLSPLDEASRKTLATRVHTQLFGAQEEIIRQGAAGNSLYVILYGQCRIYVATPEEALKPVAVLKQGDLFGEMSLMTGEDRSATVIAEEETKCLVICKDDVKDILLSKPEIAKDLSQLLAERQAELSRMAKKPIEGTPESRAQVILGKIWEFFKT